MKIIKNMKKYFFTLGTNQALSLAELQSLFPDNHWQKCGSVAITELSDDLEIKSLMIVLGGTIKIGEVIKEISLANRHALSELIKKEIIKSAQIGDDLGKFNFGFSFYNGKTPGDFFKLGLAIKKDLKAQNIASRMVTSREAILSSVIVEQNKLILNGLELCLIIEKNKVFVGKTLAVQPFKDLSLRDFGRPNRDDFSGMIPPKLAQIMLNLARGNDKKYYDRLFLDPFCGSGTILMEAYLIGFKNIVGSDISDRAVIDSQKNMDWIINLVKKESDNLNMSIFKSDVLDLESRLKKNTISYIVCEPYLGPQRGFRDFSEVITELNELYTKTLIVLADLMKSDGRIVMIWPHFRANGKVWKVKPDVGILKFKSVGVYGRETQKVWREIVILEK